MTLSGGKADATRTKHPTRTVVIIDGADRCADASLVSILVAPTSTRYDLTSKYQVEVPRGTGSLERSVVLVDLVQPIPRSAFRTKMGSFSPEKLEELHAMILSNLGVLPDE
ncbi:MAG: hypothetical protein A2V85_07955 [Chloroflexi bacterium RBG_16_72_14]|nr:MAG: hypothetical protein A2V85_07955 [Chloroflexi bacterium RBG_16_72_14]